MKPIQFHIANLEKHGVTPEEVVECFRSRRALYLRKVKRGVYRLIGQSGAGRYLELLYEDRPDEYYVFHAMDARSWQVKLLKRRGKRR